MNLDLIHSSNIATEYARAADACEEIGVTEIASGRPLTVVLHQTPGGFLHFYGLLGTSPVARIIAGRSRNWLVASSIYVVPPERRFGIARALLLAIADAGSRICARDNSEQSVLALWRSLPEGRAWDVETNNPKLI